MSSQLITTTAFKDEEDWFIFRSDKTLALILVICTSLSLLPLAALYGSATTCWIDNSSFPTYQALFINAICGDQASSVASIILYALLLEYLLFLAPVVHYHIMENGGKDSCRFARGLNSMIVELISNYKTEREKFPTQKTKLNEAANGFVNMFQMIMNSDDYSEYYTTIQSEIRKIELADNSVADMHPIERQKLKHLIVNLNSQVDVILRGRLGDLWALKNMSVRNQGGTNQWEQDLRTSLNAVVTWLHYVEQLDHVFTAKSYKSALQYIVDVDNFNQSDMKAQDEEQQPLNVEDGDLQFVSCNVLKDKYVKFSRCQSYTTGIYLALFLLTVLLIGLSSIATPLKSSFNCTVHDSQYSCFFSGRVALIVAVVVNAGVLIIFFCLAHHRTSQFSDLSDIEFLQRLIAERYPETNRLLETTRKDLISRSVGEPNRTHVLRNYDSFKPRRSYAVYKMMRNTAVVIHGYPSEEWRIFENATKTASRLASE